MVAGLNNSSVAITRELEQVRYSGPDCTDPFNDDVKD